MEPRPLSTHSATLRSRLKITASDDLTIRPIASTRSQFETQTAP